VSDLAGIAGVGTVKTGAAQYYRYAEFPIVCELIEAEERYMGTFRNSFRFDPLRRVFGFMGVDLEKRVCGFTNLSAPKSRSKRSGY
jgi:hypothetical protein